MCVLKIVLSYFFQTADEIARENENIQTQIRDLQDKFDQALSSDSDKVSWAWKSI